MLAHFATASWRGGRDARMQPARRHGADQRREILPEHAGRRRSAPCRGAEPLSDGEMRRPHLADESRHMGFSVLGLPDTIASLSKSDLRELEDFTAEACRLVLRGQFPREAFDRVGLSEHDIKEVERIRVENAKSNDYLYFRQTFRREMYTQVVSNMKKVGLMTERTAENLRKLGIDPNIDGRAATLESQPGA